MSRGVNKVIILGHLGDDPVARYTKTEQAVCNFQIATSESWKDKQTGEKQEKTEWHKIIAFNKLAEICAQFLKKGSKVFVCGKLQTKKWQDKEGKDHYTTEIICEEMQMLDSKGSQDYKPNKQSGESYMPPSSNYSVAVSSHLDNDIPF